MVEEKYTETLEYYVVAFLDVPGQREKLRELKVLPVFRPNFAGLIVSAFAPRTSGCW
jgi:hypothetical protein